MHGRDTINGGIERPSRPQRTLDNRLSSVLCGQKTKTEYPVRINLTIVIDKERDESVWPQDEAIS